MGRKIFVVGLIASVAALATVAYAANPHYVNGPTCTQDPATGLVSCAGKIAGLGSNETGLFVVANFPAGCSNPGNEDIPGQRSFVSGPFSTDQGGSFVFGGSSGNNVTAGGGVTCHGGQEVNVGSTGTLTVYQCTSGSPTFSKKTGAQTNQSCTAVLGPTNVTAT